MKLTSRQIKALAAWSCAQALDKFRRDMGADGDWYMALTPKQRATFDAEYAAYTDRIERLVRFEQVALIAEPLRDTLWKEADAAQERSGNV